MERNFINEINKIFRMILPFKPVPRTAAIIYMNVRSASVPGVSQIPTNAGKTPPSLEEFDPLNPGEWQLGVRFFIRFIRFSFKYLVDWSKVVGIFCALLQKIHRNCCSKDNFRLVGKFCLVYLLEQDVANWLWVSMVYMIQFFVKKLKHFKLVDNTFCFLHIFLKELIKKISRHNYFWFNV